MSDVKSIHLPMWAKYRAGAGDEPSNGNVEVDFHGERLTKLQKLALAAIVENAEALQPLILDAIVRAYPSFRACKPRPATITKAQLRKVIQLWEVILLKDDHEGTGYVAYGFSCAWDPSGFRVVTHGGRVVSVGGFDVLRYPIKDPARTAPEPKAPTAKQRATRRSSARKKGKKPPPLSLDQEITIALPEWAGFCAGADAELSRGQIDVAVGGDTVSSDDDVIGPHHEKAYRYLLEHVEQEQGVLLDAIVTHYPTLRKKFNGFECKMPATIDRESLQDLVELRMIHIHHAERAGVAYVGYQFACAWDSEHGLGVMTHQDRVVALGGSDTAILSWVAESDGRPKRR